MGEPIRSSGKRRSKSTLTRLEDEEYARRREQRDARKAQLEEAVGFHADRGPVRKRPKKSRRRGHNK